MRPGLAPVRPRLAPVRPGLAPAQVHSPICLTVALVLFAAATLPSPAHACTCGQRPLLDQFAAADVVFVGTAQGAFDPHENDDFESGGDPIGYLFCVDLAWKGVVTDTITVWTARSGAACGYHFQPGEDYVVLARTRDGRPSTGMCSGVERLNDALAARYLLPEPVPVKPGATWPAVSRDVLLDFLRFGSSHENAIAATLLAEEIMVHKPGKPSPARLLTWAAAESARILATETDSTAVTAGLTALAYQQLEDDGVWIRAAAIEALGALTHGDELTRVIHRGFADPDEMVRGTTRIVMIGRRADLSDAAATTCVTDFIASIAAMSGQNRWVGVDQLRFFPAQRALIRPFLQAVADTATEEQLVRTTRKVLNVLADD